SGRISRLFELPRSNYRATAFRAGSPRPQTQQHKREPPIFEVVFRPSRALAPVVLRVVCLRTRVVTPVAGAHLTTDQCSTTSLRICSILASSYRAALRASSLRSRVSQTLCERYRWLPVTFPLPFLL